MPTPTHPPDPELAREQAHLDHAREQLARMRERTASMDSAAAADWVSRQFLESTYELRMRQLQDDPTVPLFFGRVDYGAGGGEVADESFHLGRRHVSDPSGEPLVIDWRAPVSRPFYRATSADRLGVDRRRRYGFDHGRLTAYEDEDLTRGGGGEFSEILEAEIERPRVGPMRDIVATIQPEQDELVRADLSRSVCIQGAPGTGKTAVGLHRAAYLLYAYRTQLTRQGALVVGPNASFLRYIRDVLPALGEVAAAQTTIEELVGRNVRLRGTDTPELAVLKGDARMATVLERALWSLVQAPTETLVVPRGSRRWRVPAYEVEEILAELRSRGVRYDAARAMLPQRLAHRVLVTMELAGESPDDRVQDAVARSAPIKAYVKPLWPVVDAPRLLHRLLSDTNFLAEAAAGILTSDEQALLLWAKPPRSAGAARWSLHDAVLLDEAGDLLARTPSVGLVIADEAQDLSPMMLRAVGRRCSTGSLTVLGDLAQATTPWATRTWTDALHHLGKPDTEIDQLTRGFRVPGRVIEYAARLLPTIAPGLKPPTSVRRSVGDLHVRSGSMTHLRAAAEAALEQEGSVGLIVPDTDVPAARRALGDVAHALLGEDPASDENDLTTEFDTRLDLVPASLAKGLEFDHVVLWEPAGIVDGEADRVTGLRRLYVCLTRAVTSLVVLHAHPLPTELGVPE